MTRPISADSLVEGRARAALDARSAVLVWAGWAGGSAGSAPALAKVPESALSKRLAAVTSLLVWSRIGVEPGLRGDQIARAGLQLVGGVGEPGRREHEGEEDEAGRERKMPPRAKKLSCKLRTFFSVCGMSMIVSFWRPAVSTRDRKALKEPA